MDFEPIYKSLTVGGQGIPPICTNNDIAAIGTTPNIFCYDSILSKVTMAKYCR